MDITKPLPELQPIEDSPWQQHRRGVDVVVCCYFRNPRNDNDCLARLLAQDYPHLGLIVIDDASTNGMQHHLAAQGRGRRRVILDRRPLFEGPVGAFLRTAQIAEQHFPKAAYIGFVDQAFSPAPDWASSLRQQLSRSRSVLATGSSHKPGGGIQTNHVPAVLKRKRGSRLDRLLSIPSTYESDSIRYALYSLPFVKRAAKFIHGKFAFTRLALLASLHGPIAFERKVIGYTERLPWHESPGQDWRSLTSPWRGARRAPSALWLRLSFAGSVIAYGVVESRVFIARFLKKLRRRRQLAENG